MKRYHAIAVLLLASCAREPDRTQKLLGLDDAETEEQVAGTRTQVCTLDGEPCYAECPDTTVYEGNTCTFNQEETDLRKGIGCAADQTGRCYYTCVPDDGGGDGEIEPIEVPAPGLNPGTAYPDGGTPPPPPQGTDAGTPPPPPPPQGFVISTASPTCQIDEEDPDGHCDPENPDDPDCDDEECADDDACTLNHLDENGECQSDQLPCDDNDECTTDACDPELGCTHEAITCDDGDACTEDVCDSRLGCRAPAISCDDGNPCTADACDPEQGCHSTDVEDGTACDDGDSQTENDVCTAGVCGGEPITPCPEETDIE
jgi:hypothetical protein